MTHLTTTTEVCFGGKVAETELLNYLMCFLKQTRFCAFFILWFILRRLCEDCFSWVSVLWNETLKIGAHWQIVLRCLFGVLHKQMFHTWTQVKERCQSSIRSIHIPQIPLLLHMFESSVQAGSLSPEVILQRAVYGASSE